MKAFLQLILICGFARAIFIRQISDDELRHFLVYKSNMIVSPFKSQERLESQEITNYLPVRITLLNKPKIIIQKEETVHSDEGSGHELDRHGHHEEHHEEHKEEHHRRKRNKVN